VISSHELSEIETFTTHVAFMQGGRLLIQEPIDDLRRRFREVRVTLSAAKQPSQPLPGDWLLPEIAGHRLRFIASQYADDALLLLQLSQRFGAVRMECEPLALRAIVNTLMQQRKQGLKP
jgi:ABC-2 type transport system ATP-binding protein